MARARKKIDAFLNNPLGVSWEEITSILHYCGFTVESGKGSHWLVYHQRHPEMGKLTVSVHDGRMKAVYAKKIANYVEDICSQGEDLGEPES